MTHSQSNPDETALNLSQRDHRRLIGILGLALPLLLYVVAGCLPTAGLPRWTLLPSMSAYYYTGSAGFFVGVLFALGLFLVTYPGYKDFPADRVVGIIGGVAAFGVALLPTVAPDGLSEPTWWTPAVRFVHYASAIVLFTAFILFSIWLFRKSSVPKGGRRPDEKRWRDDVCFVCGIVMIGAVLWAASSRFTEAPIFWPEAIAVIAFAISWLTKSETLTPAYRAYRRMVQK